MEPLKPWMRWLLRFVGTFNILAGTCMLLFYHEGYKLLGIKKPELVLEIQLVGVLVALFGIGYHLVASNPIQNRNVLMLGFWSKALGSALGIYYFARGKMPLEFLPVLFFADIVYLPPFVVILRRLYRISRMQSADPATAGSNGNRSKAA